MFYIDYIEGKKIVRSDLIKEVECFFTTRDLCIFSKTEDVSFNRSIVNKYIGHNLAICKPVHGDNIEKVLKDKFVYNDCDGMIFEKGTAGFMNFGDCVPLFFYCDGVGIISHAGWRGTVKEIAKKSINILVNDYKSDVKKIRVIIGPAICKNCYEVGEDVYYSLDKTINKNEDILIKKEDKFFVDLKGINKQQLLECGVEEKNIDVCPYCSACGEKLFYSYRHENCTSFRHSLVVKNI